jgi:hypothetical protein
MSEESDFRKLYEQEKKKVSVLEQKLALYENDPEKSGYFALRRIVNDQIRVLNAFELKTEIAANPKEDKKYDRTKGLWEGLQPMIASLKALRQELRITPEEEEKEAKNQKNQRITPESISNVLGNTAGQLS